MKNFIEQLLEEARPSEVKVMGNVVFKEATMLEARAKALQEIAHQEFDPRKTMEICAEVTMISRLVGTLTKLAEETAEEAKRLNMIDD